MAGQAASPRTFSTMTRSTPIGNAAAQARRRLAAGAVDPRPRLFCDRSDQIGHPPGEYAAGSRFGIDGDEKLPGRRRSADKRHNVNRNEPEPPLENSPQHPIHSNDGHLCLRRQHPDCSPCPTRAAWRPRHSLRSCRSPRICIRSHTGWFHHRNQPRRRAVRTGQLAFSLTSSGSSRSCTHKVFRDLRRCDSSSQPQGAWRWAATI